LPCFSPDNLWLYLSYPTGGRLYAVETWEPGPRVGALGVFAPDNKLMAVQPTTGVIRLVDRESGREFARFEDPEFDETQSLFFTPDGSKLIGLGIKKANAIRVWDLRLIRQHLKTLGLDWDRPDYKPVDTQTMMTRLSKVDVIRGDLSKPAVTREQETQQAIARYSAVLKKVPDDAAACNSLAWVYLTAPVALRDVKAALPLAEKAVRLAADNSSYRNTLGVAYYRDGRFREAVDTLRPNLDQRDTQLLAFDLYFLAMSHQCLGETEKAQDYLAWAIRWTKAQRNLPAAAALELAEFRAEAEKLLGAKNGPER
jgi:hypothetical protein